MDKLEYVTRSLCRGVNKPLETYVINAIYQKINNPNLIIETQKEIKLDNGYRPLIDMFLPQLDIAIEVDESYHENFQQQQHDVWREQNINKQILKACKGDKIVFERIKAYGVTLESLNQRIDEVVLDIKEKISKSTLIWKSKEEVLDDIKRRGYIELDDCFDTNVEIINLIYEKNFKGWQRAGYKSLWFPVISDEFDGVLSNRLSWENFYNQTHTIIYERSTESKTNDEKKKSAFWDLDNKNKRIVFAKERDSFGKPRKRFAGVFIGGGWDEKYSAEIWRLDSTRVSFPIKG